jgi:hypothetical protein
MRRYLVPVILAFAVMVGVLAGPSFGQDPLVRGEVLKVLSKLGLTNPSGERVDGTETAPAVRGSDTDTGLFFGADTISWTLGGATAMTHDGVVMDVSGSLDIENSVITGDGGATSPALRGVDTDSGIYFAANTVGITANNAAKVSVESTAIRLLVLTALDGNVLRGNLQTVTNHSANASLNTSTMAATHLTNSGASGAINLALPGAVAGVSYFASVETNQYLRFTAATGDVISGFLSGTSGTITTSATAGFIRSTTVGSTLHLRAMDGTTWRIVGITGTWVIDS